MDEPVAVVGRDDVEVALAGSPKGVHASPKRFKTHDLQCGLAVRPDSTCVHSARDPVCAADEKLLSNLSGLGAADGDDLVRASTSLLGEACAIILWRAVKLDEVFFTLGADCIRANDSRCPAGRARNQDQRNPLPSRQPFSLQPTGIHTLQSGHGRSA